MYHSLSISGLITLDMHALNNEGAEGNTMMTRMVEIVDQDGKPHTVNAVSGDMFKHIFVEHLLGEAERAGLPLCQGCRRLDANRICADRDFIQNPDMNEKTLDSTILKRVLRACTIDDCGGILITAKIGKERSIARKSCVEIGWVVGKPGHVKTESYFHAKYVPEGREKGSGAGENLGQNIFHRPASSGQYAAVVNVDLYKVGRNDITLAYDLDDGETGEQRRKRITAIVSALASTFIKPTGAHRNTQAPHILNFEGAICTSSNSIPAPCLSPLNSNYRDQIERIAKANGGDAVRVTKFDNMAEFAERMAEIAREAVA